MLPQDTLVNGAIIISALTFVGAKLSFVPKVAWDFIKRRILYTSTIEETDNLYFYIEKWLKSHHEKNYRNVKATVREIEKHPAHYNEYGVDQESEADEEKLFISHHNDYFIIRHNGKRIVIMKSREKLEAARSFMDVYFNSFSISGLNAKKDINDLLSVIIEWNQQFKEEQTPVIYSSYANGEWSRLDGVSGKDLNHIFVARKDELVEDIDNFTNSKYWYQKRGILYKRGYILQGKAGNGKTVLCMAIAKYLNRDLYFLSIGDITNDDALRNAFRQLDKRSILVLEDVDVLFTTGIRTMSSGVSFSCLLNCLDGAFSKENVITIMTTNHIENLDPALIRAGRVDMNIEVSNPDKKYVEQYLKTFFDDESLTLVDYDNFSEPMVNIQNLCLQNKNNPQAVLDILKERQVLKPQPEL